MRFNRFIFDNYLVIMALVCDNMEASGFVSSAPFAIIAPIGGSEPNIICNHLTGTDN